MGFNGNLNVSAAKIANQQAHAISTVMPNDSTNQLNNKFHTLRAAMHQAHIVATTLPKSDQSDNKDLEKILYVLQELEDIAKHIQDGSNKGIAILNGIKTAFKGNKSATDTINNIVGVLTSISQLMLEMAALIKQLRNIMQQYNVKQQTQAWNIKLASLSQKEQSIEKNYDAELAMGVVGAVGGGLGALFGFGGLKMDSLGISELGHLASRVADGGAKAGTAKDVWQSQTSGMISDLESTNYDSYSQVVSGLEQKAQQMSQKFVQVFQDMSKIMNELQNAVRFQ